jgi:hypothetical protein
MSLAEITEGMRTRVGASAGLKKSVKFDFGDDGVVRIDDSVSPDGRFQGHGDGQAEPADGLHDGQAEGRGRHVGRVAAGQHSRLIAD